MKASVEQQQALFAAIKPHDTHLRRELYRNARDESIQDLDKRYRWDLYWETYLALDSGVSLQNLNDDHLDTVLRSIVPPLGEERKST